MRQMKRLRRVLKLRSRAPYHGTGPGDNGALKNLVTFFQVMASAPSKYSCAFW